MKKLAFTVYDSKVEAYLEPFFAPTKGAAIRSFQEAANQQGHQFSKHAADYTLFLVGSYDEVTGVLEAVNPENLGTALQYVQGTTS